MTVYRIANWNTRYENNRSRELKDAAWFPCPNVFDGDGYCYMIDGKDGPLAYCGWILLCGVASRCTPRGILVQTTGHPHTADTIAAKTRVPAKVIRLAIDRALHTKWLEPHEGAAIPHVGATTPHEIARWVREGAGFSARTEGEGNGTEWESVAAAAGTGDEVQEKGGTQHGMTAEQHAVYTRIVARPLWLPQDRDWIEPTTARGLALRDTSTPAHVAYWLDRARARRKEARDVNLAGYVIGKLEKPDLALVESLASLSGANNP